MNTYRNDNKTISLKRPAFNMNLFIYFFKYHLSTNNPITLFIQREYSNFSSNIETSGKFFKISFNLPFSSSI